MVYQIFDDTKMSDFFQAKQRSIGRVRAGVRVRVRV